MRREAAEFLGTMTLLVAVVGSGIATGGQAPAAQLFMHAVVVGVALVGLVIVFAPISGAHLNPVVSLAAAWLGLVSWTRAARFVVAQSAGAVTGVIVANLLFGHPAVALGATARSGPALWGSEVLATGGLVVVIFVTVRTGHAHRVPAVVGAWVGSAIVFTSSTCFANPAVTIARTLTDTWTGATPSSVPGLVGAQLVAVAAAVPLVTWLVPKPIPGQVAATASPASPRPEQEPVT